MSDVAMMEHPDVIWVEVDPALLVKRRRARAVEVDTGLDPKPTPSAAMPETDIDRSVGVCVCWLCRERSIPAHDHEWMLGVLAKYVLGKRQPDRDIWIQDWTLRHGKFAGAVLKRHMDRIIATEGRCDA